ncbi:lamin tail domain-containing protein [Halalkalibaculum sp. DA384]
MYVKIRSKFLHKILLFFVPLVLTLTGTTINAQPNAWINEIHYDNEGGDSEEFIEVVIKSPDSYSLSDFEITLYNGSDDQPVDSETLDSFTVGDSERDYTFYTWYPPSIQNDKEAIALSYQGSLVQFLSYEGTLTADGGPADGSTSVDIGVDEEPPPPEDPPHSLQLTGTGLQYGDFSWQEPAEASPGAINAEQYLNSTIQLTSSSNSLDENAGSFSVIVSITKPDGHEVTADISFQTTLSTSVAEDFTGPVTKTITFPADSDDGDTQSVNFTISDDNNFEGPETAVFTLGNLATSGSAKVGTPATYELTINDNDQPDVVINEILADPGGDADGDNEIDTDDDEFVEIVNNEPVAVDISGWTIADENEVQFTFEPGTILKANSAAVAFGSTGFSGNFGNSIVQGTSSLRLNNGGDRVVLKNKSGYLIDSHTYGSEGGDGTSLVREHDGSGSFVKHDGISDTNFSPGTRIDGSSFTNSLTVEGTAGWRMLSAPRDGMKISDIDAPIQGFGDGHEKNFFTGYDGSGFTAPGNLDGTLPSGKGFILYFYNNDRAGSSDLPVTLDAATGKTHTGDLTGVPLHADGDKWNLLGNPFETAINISDIGSWVNGGSLASGIGQVWDNNTESYVLTTTNDDKVESWQGFFIENDDATSIDFPLSAKTSGGRFYKENTKSGYLAFTLEAKNSSEQVTTTDKAAVLYFHENAEHERDPYDATKLLPFTARYALVGFVSLEENQEGLSTTLKAQDSRPYNFEGELSVDLQLEAQGMQGEFDLSWQKRDLPDDWSFTLVDNITGQEVDMNVHQSYSFTYQAREKELTTTAQKSEAMHSLPAATEVKAKQEEKPRFTVKTSAPGSERDASSDIPEQVKLNPNYPNPFNPATTISFELTEQAHVTLNVYTIVGQKVATLVDEVREVGEHNESWNATDMPSGIYIAQLEVMGKVYIRKMTLIK